MTADPRELPWRRISTTLIQHKYLHVTWPLYIPANFHTTEAQHQQQLQQQAAEAEKNSGLGDDDGGSLVVSKRPAHDIFRSRQQQKLSKLG